MKKFYFCILLVMLILSEKAIAQPGCTASFYIDKTASTPFNAVIMNNCTSPGIVLPDTMIYKWSWYDGSPVTYGKYPTHTYTITGTRLIKLEIKSSNNSCSDSMMLGITIDSNGVFHKTNTNYNVTVVAPTASGIKAESSPVSVHLISTMINDFANFSFAEIEEGKKIHVDVYTDDGRNILSVNDRISNNNLSIPTSSLPFGIYLAVVNVEGRSMILKMVKQ